MYENTTYHIDNIPIDDTASVMQGVDVNRCVNIAETIVKWIIYLIFIIFIESILFLQFLIKLDSKHYYNIYTILSFINIYFVCVVLIATLPTYTEFYFTPDNRIFFDCKYPLALVVIFAAGAVGSGILIYMCVNATARVSAVFHFIFCVNMCMRAACEWAKRRIEPVVVQPYLNQVD